MADRTRLCVICSSCAPPSKTDAETSVAFSTRLSEQQVKFSRFCSELEECSGGGINYESNLKNQKNTTFVAAQFLTALGKGSKRLFTCSECLALVSQAVEMKENVEQEECQVVDMQLQLLIKMKALQECTDGYFKKMLSIFERVRNAEITDLVEESKVSNRKRRRTHLEEDVDSCDVLLFREKIIDVVTYLRIFREDLNDKLLCHPTQQNLEETQLNLSTPLLSNSQPSPREEEGPDMDNVDDVEDDVDWDMDIPSDAENPVKIEKTHDESEEGADQELTNIRDPSCQSPSLNEDDEHSRPKKKMRRSVKKIKGKPQKRKRFEKAVDHAPPSNEDLLDLTMLKKRFVMFLRKRNTSLPNVTETQVDDNPSSVSTTTAAAVPLDDPKVRYRWNYEPSTDKLSLAGYHIDVVENVVSHELTYTCTTCDEFQYKYNFSDFTSDKVSNGMFHSEKIIFNHVVGRQHINAFVCTQCPDKEIETYRTYMEHLAIHDQSLQPFYCDQCGQEFRRMYGLERHMLTHMVGAEKLKALQQFYGSVFSDEEGSNNGSAEIQSKSIRRVKRKSRGVKITPKSVEPKGKRWKTDPKFQCDTCGKANFSVYAELKRHELSHIAKELRPSVICPNCGKKLVKTCYPKHLKKFCKALIRNNADDAQPLACNQCNINFQDRTQLKQHMRQEHAEFFLQMPYECNRCEVRFSSLKLLKHHRRMKHGLGNQPSN